MGFRPVSESEANLPYRYSALCWRPVTHAQTWASYSALYRFGRPWITLNGVMAIILDYSVELGSLANYWKSQWGFESKCSLIWYRRLFSRNLRSWQRGVSPALVHSLRHSTTSSTSIGLVTGSYKMRKCESAKVRKWTSIKCESGIMRKWCESVYKLRRMKMRK